MLRELSALRTPTSVTFGKSSPFAIICVPRRTSASPRLNAERMSSCEFLRDVESASMRRIFALGKHFASAASARWVPMPLYWSAGAPHAGQTFGVRIHPPQIWQRQQASARWYV